MAAGSILIRTGLIINTKAKTGVRRRFSPSSAAGLTSQKHAKVILCQGGERLVGQLAVGTGLVPSTHFGGLGCGGMVTGGYSALVWNAFLSVWRSSGPRTSLSRALLLKNLRLLRAFPVHRRLPGVYSAAMPVCKRSTGNLQWIEKSHRGDRAPLSGSTRRRWMPLKRKFQLKAAVVWLAVSFWTGFTLVAFYADPEHWPKCLSILGRGSSSGSFYAGFCYMQAGFLQRQVCKYMCPYARFRGSCLTPRHPSS